MKSCKEIAQDGASSHESSYGSFSFHLDSRFKSVNGRKMYSRNDNDLQHDPGYSGAADGDTPCGGLVDDHRRAVFAAAGAAQYNLDGQNNPVAGVRRFTARNAVEEQVCRNPAHLQSGLAHNRKRW